MPNPALKAYIDFDGDNVLDAGEEVSQYAVVNPGDTVVSIDRGANFEGGTATPGTCTLRLTNNDNRFTPGYTGGPYGSNVNYGKMLRVDALYSATTYPLFYGTIRRIVPIDGRPMVAEIYAEDMLYRADRIRSTQAFSELLAVYQFRQALIEAAFGAGTHVLSNIGPEQSRLPMGADSESLQSLLADLNEATRSIDFVRPQATPTFGATAAKYVTKDRVTLQGLAAAASYATTQIESLSGWDVEDSKKVNYQLVQAEPYTSAEEESELWRAARVISVPAGTTRVKIVKWSDPIILGKGRRPAERTRLLYDATGTASASATFYSTTARLVLTGGASGGDLKNLRVLGYPAQQVGLGYEESDLTAGDPMGEYAGQEVSSRFLASDSDAKGLADYLTRLGTLPLIASPTVKLKQNLFPDLFQREPGERITIAHGRLGLTAQDLLIESTSLQMQTGGRWSLSMKGRTYPFASIVTIGGDAAHGIGGSAILAY